MELDANMISSHIEVLSFQTFFVRKNLADHLQEHPYSENFTFSLIIRFKKERLYFLTTATFITSIT